MTTSNDRHRQRDLQRRARRLVRERGITYMQALRAIAETSKTANAPAAEVPKSASPAGGSGQNWDEAWDEYYFPTMEDLVRRTLSGDLCTDATVVLDGHATSDRSAIALAIALPVSVSDAEVEVLRIVESTIDAQVIDTLEGDTEIVTVEAEGELTVRCLVPTGQWFKLGPDAVLVEASVGAGIDQVTFTRQVHATWDMQIDVGSENVESECTGMSAM